MIIKKLAFISVLFFVQQVSFCQDASELFRKHAVEDLQQDYLKYRKHLELKCPLTYLYVSRAKVTSFLDSIQQLINIPMTELEFYRTISPISSLIKDGHNLLMPSDALVAYVSDHQSVLPIRITYLNNEIIVLKDQSEEGEIKSKSKIISINNVSIDSILQRFYQVIPREGWQTKLTDSYINKWFRFWYHLHYGLEETYRIQYTTQKGEESMVTVAGRSLDEMSGKNGAEELNELAKKGIYVELVDKTLKIAKLNVRSFSPVFLKDRYEQKKFKKEVDQCFELIFENDIEHLILDVRDNSGGNPDYSVYLLKYLFDEPFTQAIKCKVMLTPEIDDTMERTRSQWMPYYGVGTFRPKKQNYDGSLYMLINGGSFSAAIEFASTIEKYDRAIFIGEETGGNPIIMSGDYFTESRKLSNTNIVYYAGKLCTIYDDVSNNTGRGIIPDYPVKYTVEDIIQDKDVALEKALWVIHATEDNN